MEEECLSRTRVFEWCKLSEGEELVENTLHNRRPRTSITSSNIDSANELTWDNRYIIVKEFASILNTSVGV